MRFQIVQDIKAVDAAHRRRRFGKGRIGHGE
jgi:hypothetical protein